MDQTLGTIVTVLGNRDGYAYERERERKMDTCEFKMVQFIGPFNRGLFISFRNVHIYVPWLWACVTANFGYNPLPKRAHRTRAAIWLCRRMENGIHRSCENHQLVSHHLQPNAVTFVRHATLNSFCSMCRRVCWPVYGHRSWRLAHPFSRFSLLSCRDTVQWLCSFRILP